MPFHYKPLKDPLKRLEHLATYIDHDCRAAKKDKYGRKRVKAFRMKFAAKKIKEAVKQLEATDGT